MVACCSQYNQLTYTHPLITTVCVSQLGNVSFKFDTALSITRYNPRVFVQFQLNVGLSSFDHDGLGRYGDPLNPNGDLLAMSTASSLLKLQGMMMLTVPIGIVWSRDHAPVVSLTPLLIPLQGQMWWCGICIAVTVASAYHFYCMAGSRWPCMAGGKSCWTYPPRSLSPMNLFLFLDTCTMTALHKHFSTK